MARKILLADDSVTAQNMGRKILADAGYEVITVNNGSAALKKIAEQKPDLIVLDVYMPGYSGLEVCQRLKEAPETARVPVLLTVGKLEPFKPEEAKRVRADGFIVKPFEASELLAALSKMEDKIVPRAEASKPGRFARVTAAIEEGRYDKTVAIDGDSGWKDRLSFPSRKKEKTAPENGESAAIDRPIDKPTEKPHATRAEEARVDLGALAPEGLPKDVTPEEIAALAAAAAQVKGKMAESKLDEPALAAASTEAAQPSEKIEEKYAPQANSTEAAEAASVAAANHSDLIAAISGLDTAPLALPSASLESGFSSQALADHASTDHAPTDHGAAGQRANEPVTMALPGAGSVADAPRWTAVSMALGKEEAAISLELEMQKAYAAFAAAVNGHTSSGLAVPENRLDLAQIATDNSSSPEAEPREPAVTIPALPAPEAVQPLSGALGNASTEAIRAAVQELEMVAESFVGETAAPAEPTSAAVAEQAEVSHLAAAGLTVEAVASESSTTGEAQPEAAKLDLGKRDEQNSWRPEATNQEWKTQSWKSEELRAGEQQAERQKKEEQKNDQWKNESPLPTAPAPAPEESHGTAAAQDDITAPTFTNTVSAEQTSAGQSPSSRELAVAAESAAGSEPARKESEATATTAAAWASWRRIRESGDSNPVSDEPVQKEVEQTSISQDVAAKDVAAMAVAAGAEKTPGSADSDSDPAAIASIVDSVLADLRPKIFEEISRKMGQKK